MRLTELRLHADVLLNDPKGFRRDIIEFLVFAEGLQIWEATGSEREFYRFAVATGPARESVFSSLRKQWPGNSPPDIAAVVSPFFDPPASANSPARELWALLRQRGNATVEFNLTAEEVPGEQAVLLHAPQSLLTAQPANRAGAKTVIQRLKLEEGRPLHAKSLWLENDSVAMLLMGSSNFTSAGLGLGDTKNLEANLAYAVSWQNREAADALCDAFLPAEEIPADIELRWQPRVDEGENSAAAPFVALPAAFGEANFGSDEMQHGFVEFTFRSADRNLNHGPSAASSASALAAKTAREEAGRSRYSARPSQACGYVRVPIATDAPRVGRSASIAPTTRKAGCLGTGAGLAFARAGGRDGLGAGHS